MANQIDDATMLASILSGGVIGGTVALADRGFGRAKYAIPAGMVMGIFLDYQLKKRRNKESIEVSKGYFEKMWEWVRDNEAEDVPESNSYWSALSQSLAALATIGLTSA